MGITIFSECCRAIQKTDIKKGQLVRFTIEKRTTSGTTSPRSARSPLRCAARAHVLFSSCIRPLITQAPGLEHAPSGGTAIRSAQGPSIVRPIAGPRGKPQESKTQAAQGQPRDPRLRTRPLGAEANIKNPKPRRPKVSPGPDRGVQGSPGAKRPGTLATPRSTQGPSITSRPEGFEIGCTARDARKVARVPERRADRP